MAFTFTFDVEAASTNNNSVTTGTVDSTGAKFIVILCNHDNASAVAPTDSKGNTWTAATRYKAALVGSQFYYCINPTVGSGHTFTLSSTGNYPGIGVIGFSTATDASIDQQNGATSTSASSLASGSITPSANNALVVTGSTHYNNGAPTAQTSPWTNTAALNTTTNSYGVGMAYEIQTTATTRSATWAWSGAAQNMTSIIASFTEGAAATGNPWYHYLMNA